MERICQITDSIYQAEIWFVRPKKYHALGITHILGMTKNSGEVIDIPYFQIKRDDPETPEEEEISQAVSFALHCLNNGGKLLVHCDAGKNRSGAVIVLIRAIFEKRRFDDVATEMHNEYMLETPPHNWWPYEHLTKAYKDYLSSWCIKLLEDL